jgi:class 3 adenylate cyclase/AmiR/NasT family two-component response regulator
MIMSFAKILITGNSQINIQDISKKLLEYEQNWGTITCCNNSASISEFEKCDLIIIDSIEKTELIIDVISQIKHSLKNWDTSILVCLHENNPKNIIQILEAGALDFLIKPFSSIELFARVRTGLILSSSVDKANKQTKQISAKENHFEELLNNILPLEIITEISTLGYSKPKKYKNASVLFVDLVDFTKKVKSLSEKIIFNELSEIFSTFDKIIRTNHCTRIKTMGDGYLAVSGIPNFNNNHAVDLLNAAVEMQNFILQRNKANAITWEIKVGINSGEVIGGILGKNRFPFDVFGDTVNGAARMETMCAPNQINVTRSTYLLTRHKFTFIERLSTRIKGMGIQHMYYLKSPVDFPLINLEDRNTNNSSVKINTTQHNTQNSSCG